MDERWCTDRLLAGVQSMKAFVISSSSCTERISGIRMPAAIEDRAAAPDRCASGNGPIARADIEQARHKAG
jgi:hypothetical protein